MSVVRRRFATAFVAAFCLAAASASTFTGLAYRDEFPCPQFLQVHITFQGRTFFDPLARRESFFSNRYDYWACDFFGYCITGWFTVPYLECFQYQTFGDIYFPASGVQIINQIPPVPPWGEE